MTIPKIKPKGRCHYWLYQIYIIYKYIKNICQKIKIDNPLQNYLPVMYIRCKLFIGKKFPNLDLKNKKGKKGKRIRIKEGGKRDPSIHPSIYPFIHLPLYLPSLPACYLKEADGRVCRNKEHPNKAKQSNNSVTTFLPLSLSIF